MAHPTRGHRSGTYEIQQILTVDHDELAITYRHAAAYQPQVMQLNADNTPAARQLLQAMADSIKVGDNGDADSGWESSVTLDNNAWNAKVMLERLHDQGFATFDDSSLDVPVLRSLYEPMHSNRKRSACWLLARAVRDNHPNGVALAQALKNTRFVVEETDPFVYDDAVADAIEACARGVYTARFNAQRNLFTQLGYDVTGRDWLRIDAAELIDWATTEHPDLTHAGAPQPFLAERYDRQVAWALTHPDKFGWVKYRKKSQVSGPTMQAIGRALYPDHVLLAAALTLHCLGENSGFNHSVLLEKNVASLTYLGPDHALEHSIKARNRTQDTRPTALTSIYTPGGIVETLTGLTRFSRHARRHLRNPGGTRAAVVDRIYVEHSADPEAAQVLTTERLHNAWRTNDFDDYWPDGLGPRDDVPLRLSALRRVALARAMNQGLRGDVHGHTDRTRVHYAAHVLPDHVFNRHATAAQDAFHDDAVTRFKIVTDATDGPAADLAAVDPQNVMDVEIGLCTSGGQAPDDPHRRCDLGIVACFTCPNGYRTVDHVPGLLAAVELGDIIERNDPDEWANGQAADLRYYADACLAQFPPLVVNNVRRTTDLTPHILTVTGMYMEMRHG